ncbi:MAG: alpha-glucan family phosphorylase [Pseudomonadota bacterium]|nr:alpha-glucan family phosphorylase [Pseudomonadota bacterium]
MTQKHDSVFISSAQAGTTYEVEAVPQLPLILERLRELAGDLYYSWAIEVRQLFHNLDRDLWVQVGHNPKLFLRRVAQAKLNEAACDPLFLENYHRILSAYDSYLENPPRADVQRFLNPETDLVAYFCAEFGFHESLPMYSGGLGILAGDHCKAASDLGLPFFAVGLLYGYGYFTQTIDAFGNQIASYTPSNFGNLPISQVLDVEGEPLAVHLDMPDGRVSVHVWAVRVGHIRLYLLDTDVPGNAPQYRRITSELYPGDSEKRFQQELVLGVCGVRALRTLGLSPTVWHINEGHPAFQILERCREYVAQGLSFDAALEAVATTTVFTTHTPVPAGHDVFHQGLVQHYFSTFAAEMNVSMDRLLELGVGPGGQGGFNMTALATRGSRFQNGVSRIHGEVASRMLGFIWPRVPREENPVRYVTNGVHVPTFLAFEWQVLFDMTFGREWRRQLTSESFWERVDEMPDYRYWSTRQSLKSELLRDVRRLAVRQFQRNGFSELEIERHTQNLSPGDNDILIVGFARRFATYKRANLLFSDLERLIRIVSNSERPVLFLFAGKAHPKDLPGQHLIQSIYDLSRRREFVGKLILLEGYDMALARKLVAGVDIWLNTPEYPLEASGTSGQKAAINGAVNLSVLDGWWAEGYNMRNGWAIAPHITPHTDPATRDRFEAQALLDILEHQAIPLYYERNGHGYSEGWVSVSKASMKSTIPRFNASRMVLDYVRDHYSPASHAAVRLRHDEGASAQQLAEWKRRIEAGWDQVQVRRVDGVLTELPADKTLPIRIMVRLGGLRVSDVAVECVLGVKEDGGDFTIHRRIPLCAMGGESADEELFSVDLTLPLSGLQHYKLRVYPRHELMIHPLESGLLTWL